jgi:hypothetical protein
VNLRISRLIVQHVLKEGAKILPLLGLRELRLNLASADLKGGKQIQRPVTLVSVFSPRTTLPLSWTCPRF